MRTSRSLCLFLSTLGLTVAGCSPRLPDFTELVEETSPVVVNIGGAVNSSHPAVPGLPQMPESHPFERWFRDFFEREESSPESAPRDLPQQSLGSGFVLGEDGEILTNWHVVRNASEIVVTLADRRQFNARLIGADERSDLALLKIDARDLPEARLGRGFDLKVGAWVLAIGSPFGFERTVTAGIVSAIGRSLRGEQYVPFIQTDVAINPGNSGGPLFNLDGEVVGVNSQIYSQTGGYMGLSFAIPIETAMRVVEQLRESGEVRRGWLGVVIQEVSRELAASFGLAHAQGALISRVLPESPAEAAGLMAGDIVLEVNGRPVRESAALPPLIGQIDPGETAVLRILRDGKRRKLNVELGELRGDEDPLNSGGRRIGVGVRATTEAERAEHGLDGGVVVTELDPGPGHDAGLQAGDLIEAIAGRPVRDPEQFRALLAALPPGSATAVLVRRGEQALFLALTLPDD